MKEVAKVWTAQEVPEFIERRLGYVRMRPLMYGGNADAVETLLGGYLQQWSCRHDRSEDFEFARSSRSAALKAVSANFSTHYRRHHQKQSEAQATNSVALQYKKIIQQLQLPVPGKQIEAERRKILRNLKRDV